MIKIEEAKMIINRIGEKLNVSPRMIASRLLSKEDKADMLNGMVSVSSLEAHVKVFVEVGMPDYTQGRTCNCEDKNCLKSNVNNQTYSEGE